MIELAMGVDIIYQLLPETSNAIFSYLQKEAKVINR